MTVDRNAVQDVVVFIPGIMGSALADAEGRAVWSISPGSLVRAIRTFGESVKALTLPEDIGDEHPGDGVRALGVIGGLHVIPGCGARSVATPDS